MKSVQVKKTPTQNNQRQEHFGEFIPHTGKWTKKKIFSWQMKVFTMFQEGLLELVDNLNK